MSRFNRIRQYIASHQDHPMIRSGAHICRFYLDCFDNARHWSFETNGESLILQSVLQNSNGDVLDVGAHTGEYALLVARLDHDRPIHAFEPLPQFATKATTACRDFENIRVYNFGLSDVSGPQRVFMSKRHPTTCSTTLFVHDFEKDAIFDRFDCQFERGDEFICQNGVGKVALLKLDVEGMESRVLHGFGSKFDPALIEVIQFEHGPVHAETGETVRTFRRLFEQHDFVIFAIYPNGLREPSNVGINSESFRGRNFLAVGKPHLHKFRDLVIGTC
jgi:FkbM family methyltransferase